MITTKITIKQHIKEYLIGRWNNFDEKTPVHFPAQLDLYILIWDLLVKRPVNYHTDSGNLEIVLPERGGIKDPRYYNYLSLRSQKRIEKKIELMMWADFREFIEIERLKGYRIIDAVSLFRNKYGILSLSEDALCKSYYRWRNRLQNREKRKYLKKNFTEQMY